MAPGKHAHLSQLQAFARITDAQVVSRVLSGDHPLFELLMRRYNRRLFRVARAILMQDQLAEDAVQEAYISAFQNLHQFRGPHGFGAWLTRITARAALRIARRESPLRLVEDLDRVDTGGELVDTGAQTGVNPEITSMRRESVNQLEHAIDALPRDFRLVFILRELEEMSVEETARCLAIQPGTVKSRLHRARQILRKSFPGSREDLQLDVFRFAGRQCDRIVANVFRSLIKRISVD